MDKTQDILTPRRVLWLALATVLAASAVHVAGTFSTLEPGGALPVLARLGPYTAVLAAIAVDLGLIALSWGIGSRKRAEPDKTPIDLWVGVAIFFVLSALANFDHALTVVGARVPYAIGAGQTGAAAWADLDRYTRAKVIALSAMLPLLAIYLTRVIETAANEGRVKKDEDKDVPAGQNVRADNIDFLEELTRYNAARDRGDPNVLPPTSRVTIDYDRLASYDDDDDDDPPASAPPVPIAPSQDIPAIDWPVHINGVGTITIPPGTPPSPPAPKRPATSQAKLTPELYRALAAEHVPDGTGAQEADKIVAGLAKVSTKTAQRARLAMS